MTMRPLPQSTRAVIAGAACLTILAGMLVGHAWPLWTGRTVTLPVTPVDPRDLFRGEYVRLNTPLTSVIVTRAAVSQPPGVESIPARGAWPAENIPGRVVYVQLEAGTEVPGGSGTPDYRARSISVEPVPGALNLRGRVRSAAGSHAEQLRIDYGLDAFFMQEGAPRGVEDAIRAGRRVQMEVAIASSGRARIRNLIVDGTPLPR